MIWMPFAILGGIIVVSISIGFMLDVHDKRAKQRETAMREWLDARPVLATRQAALEKVAEAYADTRITGEEHTQFVGVIELAMTNREIEDILTQIAEVRRPD